MICLRFVKLLSKCLADGCLRTASSKSRDSITGAFRLAIWQSLSRWTSPACGERTVVRVWWCPVRVWWCPVRVLCWLGRCVSVYCFSMDSYRDCFSWVPCPYWGALCFGLQDSFGGLALLCGSLSFLIQRLMCWVGPFGVRIG